MTATHPVGTRNIFVVQGLPEWEFICAAETAEVAMLAAGDSWNGYDNPNCKPMPPEIPGSQYLCWRFNGASWYASEIGGEDMYVVSLETVRGPAPTEPTTMSRADLLDEVVRLKSALKSAKESRAAADARSARRKARFRAAEAKNLLLEKQVADLIDFRNDYEAG